MYKKIPFRISCYILQSIFGDIITVIILYKKQEAGTNFVNFFSLKIYDDSENLFPLTNQHFTISRMQENPKMFNIASKYFSIFSNTLFAS